jgi:hypothetical protein
MIKFAPTLCATAIKLRRKTVIARSTATRQSLKGVRSLAEIATAFGLAITQVGSLRIDTHSLT